MAIRLMLMEYIIVGLILWGSLLLYFKLADRFNIVDKPNARSSHVVPTIRGGGIIFLLATLLFCFFNGFKLPFLCLAVFLAGAVSFADDIQPVRNSIKFLVHVLAVCLLFKECNLFSILPLLGLFLIFILVTGVINAYNFMDGINGITGMYSLAVLLPILLTEHDPMIRSLELYITTGLIIFNFYNTRKKAACFAGDVGSISLAILLCFMIIMRVKQSGNFSYIALLLVYGIDTVYTILQRLYFRENIFKPHREHLYQYLCNRRQLPHVTVSSIYAAIQLHISLGIVFNFLSLWTTLTTFVLLSTVYWYLKLPLIKDQQE